MKPKHQIKYVGIDSWNRPVFKLLNNSKDYYYGSVNTLFGLDATEEQVRKKVDISEIVYFGTTFDCEPEGTSISNTEIKWKKEAVYG